MYRIFIDEELKMDIYKNLIDFAFSKSDAFMLVTYRHCSEWEAKYTAPDRKLYDSEDRYLMFLNCFERMKKEGYENSIVFKNSTEPFLEKLKPYLIKKRNSPTEWPSTKVVFFDDCTSVDICIYRVCDEIKPFLLEASGLFKWRYPYFPDDLCFFKNGTCWFFTSAHEGYACIYLNDIKDSDMLEHLGIKFTLEKCHDNVNLFFEDYKL